MYKRQPSFFVSPPPPAPPPPNPQTIDPPVVCISVPFWSIPKALEPSPPGNPDADSRPLPPLPPAPMTIPPDATSTRTSVPLSQVPVLKATFDTLPAALPITFVTWIIIFLPFVFDGLGPLSPFEPPTTAKFPDEFDWLNLSFFAFTRFWFVVCKSIITFCFALKKSLNLKRF